jgi:hypothetical protein
MYMFVKGFIVHPVSFHDASPIVSLSFYYDIANFSLQYPPSGNFTNTEPLFFMPVFPHNLSIRAVKPRGFSPGDIRRVPFGA